MLRRILKASAEAVLIGLCAGLLCASTLTILMWISSGIPPWNIVCGHISMSDNVSYVNLSMPAPVLASLLGVTDRLQTVSIMTVMV